MDTLKKDLEILYISSFIMLYIHVIKGVNLFQSCSDILPNLLVGFLLKSDRSKL